MAPDAALRDDVPALRAALLSYRASNADFGHDHAPLADQLEAVIDEAMAVSASVGVVASALASLDATPSTGIRRVPTAAFGLAYERIGRAWEEVDDLRELVVPMGEDDWIQQVWGGLRCPPAEGKYTGSGGLRGPDGRIFALVIPELEIDGETAHVAYTAEPDRDPSSLGGVDQGWRVIDERAGVARVEEYESSMWDKVVVTMAMTSGLPGPGHQLAALDELETIGFAADGRPMATSWPADRPHDPRSPVPGASPVPAGRPARRRASRSRANAVDFVLGAADGWQVTSGMDDASYNLYRVLFEEHEDGGRRRARLHTYQLSTTSAGSEFVPFMGYAVGDELRRKRVTVAPALRPSVTHGGGTKPSGADSQVSHRSRDGRASRDARR